MSSSLLATSIKVKPIWHASGSHAKINVLLFSCMAILIRRNRFKNFRIDVISFSMTRKRHFKVMRDSMRIVSSEFSMGRQQLFYLSKLKRKTKYLRDTSLLIELFGALKSSLELKIIPLPLLIETLVWQSLFTNYSLQNQFCSFIFFQIHWIKVWPHEVTNQAQQFQFLTEIFTVYKNE